MEPNITKCKVMNIGSIKTVGDVRSYSLQSSSGESFKLTHTIEERDLGVILTPDFKFSTQVSRAASKSISILSMLKHTFLSRDVETWATLYRTYIRPHLEFAVSAWSPFLRRDILALEKVQRRVTRLPKPLKGVDYRTRLERMNLTSLELRRQRGDLIKMFKIVRGADKVEWHREPLWSERREPKRCQLRREIVSSCQQRHNFFFNRIAKQWNELPDEVVESATVEVFKSKLDDLLSR